MSLIQRKPRPLDREQADFRDDRLFIVACDDTFAPRQYFSFFNITRVQVHVVSTQDGSSVAKYVLGRLLEFECEDDDELWMLLDTDHCTQGNHFKGFIQAIEEAERRGVCVALSKPCFELWLLLHHVEEAEVVSLSNARETESALRTVLGEYNKTRLKETDYPLNSVRDACIRAETLDRTVVNAYNPEKNTSHVYRLWKAIAAKALPSQLPDALRGL
ncbi:RloB family protein [Desulfobacterales bacterium HSG2]|nr:RloB family protein [Desulfobacterales bacterium HSG2]